MLLEIGHNRRLSEISPETEKQCLASLTQILLTCFIRHTRSASRFYFSNNPTRETVHNSGINNQRRTEKQDFSSLSLALNSFTVTNHRCLGLVICRSVIILQVRNSSCKVERGPV